MRNHLALLLAASLVPLGCEGPAGTNGLDGVDGPPGGSGSTGGTGPTGSTGPTGPGGPTGTPGCDGLAADQVVPLAVKLSVAPAKNGMFFAAGEQLVMTIDLVDRCNRPVAADALATLNLYMSGPRSPLETRAAVKLLNAITDRNVADRQHHYVNLKTPRFLDANQKNLAATSTGFTFTTAAVSDEAQGTYTVGLWVVSKDLKDQQLVAADVQIGTATVETYTTGEPGNATCNACHLGPANGRSYMAHTFPRPGFSPFGNYALDQTPVQNCKLCHNSDGYSVNNIVAKVHGVHRGASLLNPGEGHPEYGMPADGSLTEFVNVHYPDFPNGERDCVKCHATDSWRKNPSRMACGSCHDNVFFDTGTLDPVRNLGKPYRGTQYAGGAAFACAMDSDCVGFGMLATCDIQTGACMRKTHPKQLNDDACSTCHTDDGGISPIADRHDVPSRSKLDGVTISNVTISGMSGGADPMKPTFFQVGDVPMVKFRLATKAGPMKTLIDKNDPNYANWSVNAIIAGPSENPQRVWPMVNVKTAVDAQAKPVLGYDANADLYTFTFPKVAGEQAAGWPASALLPLNSQPSVQPNQRQVHVPGSYTMWFYIAETLRPAAPNTRNLSWRDVANFETAIRFGSDGASQMRQVIAEKSCDSCHVVTQAHGGSRQEPHVCFTCHTQGAEDRGVVGTKGAKCTANTQAADCVGFNAGYEACQDTNNDTVADTCVLIKDATPNQQIDFSVMVHQLHFARKLEGYAQRNNIPYKEKLSIIGFSGVPEDFSEILFPMDVRNCIKCHGNSEAKCDANNPCGYGQSCIGGTCQNVAYMNPSARVCLSCHDTGAAYAHAALNTWTSPEGPLEACNVCHGPSAEFSVPRAHNIASPYQPPYSRTEE